MENTRINKYYKAKEDKSIFFTAEIGINHNGDMNIVKKLIDLALKTGCDAVKFQKRTLDIVYDKEMLDSPRESPWGTTQREQKNGLELGNDEYNQIDEYCKEKGIDWFASSWDLDSQNFLRKYNLQYNKIASAMLTYNPLLEMVAEEGKHTFISVGMSTLDDIDCAVNIFSKANCPFELMYTVSTYPCEVSDIDLNCIPMLRNRYGCSVGYSGHERSAYFVCLAVVAIGATSIERHITVDRTMYGSDQSASLEESGLRQLVRGIRAVEKTLGDGEKRVINDEISIAKKLRWFEN